MLVNSYETYAKNYGLDRDVMKWFGDYYIRVPEDAQNPLLAPIQADVTGLPPTFLLVAENDVLRDEGLAYAKKLQQSGVLVKQSIASGLVHSYFTKNDVFEEEIDDTIEEIASFLAQYIYRYLQTSPVVLRGVRNRMTLRFGARFFVWINSVT